MNFRKLYFHGFFSPDRSFDQIKNSSKNLVYAFRAVLISAILYTLIYIFLVLGDGRPFHPWLDIDDDVYYRYNVFFCLPSMYFAWILSAAVVHLISVMIFSTKGNFEGLVSLFGFSIGIATWSTGLHDLITSFLGAIHVIDQQVYESALNSNTIWRSILWILMAIYMLWFIILFSKSVRLIHGLDRVKSTFLGLLAFIIYQGFFLIFNR